MEEKRPSLSHSLLLENRERGTVTGVTDIKAFDEKEIFLSTEAGNILVKGEALHVKRLNLENGEADITGRVDSILYTSKGRNQKEESLWKRIWK